MKNNRHDFDALTAEIFRANVHHVDFETEFIYGVYYPQALAMAIEQRDYAMLIRLYVLLPCLVRQTLT